MTNPTPSPKATPPSTHPAIQWFATFAIRFAPLGGSLGILGSFLWNQEWFNALLMFPPTVATTIWAGYSKSFLENIGKRSETWGEHNSNIFANWVEQSARTLARIVTKPEVRYLECQKRDCVYNDIEGYEQRNVLLLRDVFVPLRLTHADYACGPMGSGNLRRTPELLLREDLTIWELLRQVPRRPDYGRMVILAKGGYGKTTLLRHIAYTYCEQTYRKFKVLLKVPVLIYLRRWWNLLAQADAPDLPTLMTDHHIPVLPGGKDITMPVDWAKTLLEQGGALVMVDGFDEVAEAQRTAVSGWLNQQMQWYPKNWFILTSRHDGYNQGYEGKHHFKSTVSVQEFKPEQWQRFIHQWFLCTERGRRADSDRNITTVKSAAEDRANALIAQIEAPERPDLAEMATNPLMLSMLTSWYQFYHTKTLPRYRAELYGSIIKMQLKDRPEAKGVELPLPLKDSRRVLQWLAMAMQANKTL
ncbi:MAG: NACHT domain-containing protein [Cyanothece sp. SIO2G6]|nr:NACHT domain-containing protein [Cyanothece sp. SIO2G6]